MPDTLERRDHAADERPVSRLWLLPAVDDPADGMSVDLSDRLWAWVEAHREEDGQRKPVVVAVFDADLVMDEIVARAPVRAGRTGTDDSGVAASTSTSARAASDVAAGAAQPSPSSLPSDRNSGGADVVPEMTSSAGNEPELADDGSITIQMFGKQVRFSSEDQTYWTRFHDAPDSEWHSWGIDWTEPGGKLVRR